MGTWASVRMVMDTVQVVSCTRVGWKGVSELLPGLLRKFRAWPGTALPWGFSQGIFLLFQKGTKCDESWREVGVRRTGRTLGVRCERKTYFLKVKKTFILFEVVCFFYLLINVCALSIIKKAKMVYVTSSKQWHNLPWAFFKDESVGYLPYALQMFYTLCLFCVLCDKAVWHKSTSFLSSYVQLGSSYVKLP